MAPDDLWRFLPLGYLITVVIETPILLFGLSRNFSLRQKLLAGAWLTACTYPIVTLVLPLLLGNTTRALYLLVAEIFAPAAECLLFWLAFDQREAIAATHTRRNFAVIIVANLASFLLGEVISANGWFGLYR